MLLIWKSICLGAIHTCACYWFLIMLRSIYPQNMVKSISNSIFCMHYPAMERRYIVSNSYTNKNQPLIWNLQCQQSHYRDLLNHTEKNETENSIYITIIRRRFQFNHRIHISHWIVTHSDSKQCQSFLSGHLTEEFFFFRRCCLIVITIKMGSFGAIVSVNIDESEENCCFLRLYRKNHHLIKRFNRRKKYGRLSGSACLPP